MATLEKRVQVLFDPSDYALVESEARAHGVSVGAFIREATNNRIAAERTNARASWQQLWRTADTAPAADPLDWEQLKAAYENELDPMWRLSHSASGEPRDEA